MNAKDITKALSGVSALRGSVLFIDEYAYFNVAALSHL
jgi:hypothetical protein